MLSILTVNIGAASRERAEVMLRWLAGRPESVFMLTETSAGEGTRIPARPLPPGRLRRGPHPRRERRPRNGHRESCARCCAAHCVIRWCHHPQPHRSRGPRHRAGYRRARRVRALARPQRQQDGEEATLRGIAAACAGRTARRATRPPGARWRLQRHRTAPTDHCMPAFCHSSSVCWKRWSCTAWSTRTSNARRASRRTRWVGRTGDGYRYDYFHVGRELADRIAGCGYLHETREQRLTDHAAVDVAPGRGSGEPVGDQRPAGGGSGDAVLGNDQGGPHQ